MFCFNLRERERDEYLLTPFRIVTVYTKVTVEVNLFSFLLVESFRFPLASGHLGLLNFVSTRIWGLRNILIYCVELKSSRINSRRSSKPVYLCFHHHDLHARSKMVAW